MEMKGEKNMSIEEEIVINANPISTDDYKYNLDLVNHWIDSADSKIEIAFGIFSTILTAFSIFAGISLKEIESNCKCWYYVLLVLTIIAMCVFAVGLGFFFFALKPNLSSADRQHEYSIYYKEIQTFSNAKEYAESCDKAAKCDFEKELISEIFYNSKICTKKMIRFNRGLVLSGIAICISFFVLIVLLVL